MTVEKIPEGYRICQRVFDRVYVLLDKKRELLLHYGTEDSVMNRFNSLLSKCRGSNIVDKFESDIRVMSMPKDISFDEMQWMLCHFRIPRRLKMRIK